MNETEVKRKCNGSETQVDTYNNDNNVNNEEINEVITKKFEVCKMNRTSPHSIPAERELLGTIFTFPESINLLSLKPEQFYKSEHKYVYEAMRNVEDITINTVTEELKKKNHFNDIDLIDIMDQGFSSSTNIPNERIIKEKYKLRKLIELSSNTVNQCHSGEEVNDIINGATDKLIGLSSAESVGSSLTDCLHRYNYIVDRRKAGEIMAVNAPILDDLQYGQTCVLGALPGVGKTSLATQLLLGCNCPAGLVMLESTDELVAGRMLAQESQVDFHKIDNGLLNHVEMQRISAGLGRISEMNIQIEPNLDNIADIMALAYKWKVQNNIKLLVIDYLQLMEGGKSENKNLEVTEIMRKLVRFGKKQKIALLILSQFKRIGESEPTMQDFRDSGSIEQFTDKLVALHKPNPADKTRVKCITLKYKNGKTGSKMLEYNPPTMTFREDI